MAAKPRQTHVWALKNKPTGMPILTGSEATFSLQTNDVPELKQGQVLVKALYLSNDPAQRGWIDPRLPKERLYVPPVEVGDPMRARGIGQVVESTSEQVAVGAIVRATINWCEYTVLDASTVYVIRPLSNNLSLTHFLGALGSTGLTAYYGLVVISEAKSADKIVVSGAAGATGSMVVQIATKLLGAENVIGIAGNDEKCRWVEKLGAKQCLNYKSPSFQQDLIEATSLGVDLFFDNVGGEILDGMLARMSRNGRITACGAITGYNSDEPCILKNYFQIITMRLQLKGFIVLDYPQAQAIEAQNLLQRAIEDGKLQISDANETVVATRFEDIPQTWLKLFSGENTGKLVTKLI